MGEIKRDSKGKITKGVAQKTNKNGTAGRKWFNGQDEDAVVALLKQAWAIDCSPQECQLHANISKDSYYRYLEAHPELSEESERLRNRPMLKARHELVKGLTTFDNALKYAKNKRNKEFNERSEVTGAEGKDLIPTAINIVTNGDNI